MSAEDSSTKDVAYEKQISEANELGNALLSGLIAEGIARNKKNIKIGGGLLNLRELIANYKNEVEKLKSLQIGSCYDVIDLKRRNSCQAQIELSGTMLKKIDDTLKAHVKHNESKVISKEEIKDLRGQISLLNSIQEELKHLPDPGSQGTLKEHLKTIDDIQSNLEQITATISSTKSKVEDLQQDVISQSSDVLYCSI